MMRPENVANLLKRIQQSQASSPRTLETKIYEVFNSDCKSKLFKNAIFVE